MSLSTITALLLSSLLLAACAGWYAAGDVGVGKDGRRTLAAAPAPKP